MLHRDLAAIHDDRPGLTFLACFLASLGGAGGTPCGVAVGGAGGGCVHVRPFPVRSVGSASRCRLDECRVSDSTPASAGTEAAAKGAQRV